MSERTDERDVAYAECVRRIKNWSILLGPGAGNPVLQRLLARYNVGSVGGLTTDDFEQFANDFDRLMKEPTS